MFRLPVTQSHSPVAQIESIDGHIRRLLTVLDKADTVVLQALSDLSLQLQTFANQSLESRIIEYLAGIPRVLEVIVKSRCLPTAFMVADAGSDRHLREASSMEDNSEYADLCIVNCTSLKNCATAAYELGKSLPIRRLLFWGEGGSRLQLAILCAAAPVHQEIGLSVNGTPIRISLRCLPLAPQHVREVESYRLTLVASLFRGEKYLPSFIENLALSGRFPETCLMIFDAGANESDLGVLGPYLSKYRNIKYFALTRDPGLYDIWNLGVHLSASDYIGNANLDDRRHPLELEAVLSELESNKDVMLASTHVVPMTDFEAEYDTYVPAAPHVYFSWLKGSYAISDMFRTTDAGNVESHCIPHCMPIWRRELHEHCGYFCEERYKSAADYELWLRGMASGLKFSLVDVPASYYYVNPNSYMRVDATHESVGEEMHAQYMQRKSRRFPPYMPDFEHLRSLIRFRVN
jgi:hypothetical protein